MSGVVVNGKDLLAIDFGAQGIASKSRHRLCAGMLGKRLVDVRCDELVVRYKHTVNDEDVASVAELSEIARFEFFFLLRVLKFLRRTQR